jgi:hypothetical protein
MAAALTIVPASGAITAVVSTAHIYVTGTPTNAADGTEITYRIRARKTGLDDLISHKFAPNADGKHQWDDVTFPAAGSWTITLRKASDDSQVATASVTVI